LAASPSSAAFFDRHRHLDADCKLRTRPGRALCLALEALQQLEYANIAHLDGGLKARIAGDQDVARE
jgi:hypothetical protein